MRKPSRRLTKAEQAQEARYRRWWRAYCARRRQERALVKWIDAFLHGPKTEGRRP